MSKSSHIDKQAPLSVGDVATRSGVAVSTIHFYEQQGLIKGWRNSGNQRRFHRDVLRRIAVIKVAQSLGLPLAAIAEALATLPTERTVTAVDWKRLSATWHDELTSRINLLTQLRDQLGECIGCGCLSLEVCQLRNPDDRLARKGPGAHL